MKRLFVFAFSACLVTAAFGWGPGHDTTVRCIEKRFPKDFTSHLKEEWVPLWEEASHLPDAGRHDLLKEPDRSFLEKNGWKGMALHENKFRFLLFDCLVGAICRGDWYEQFMLVSALSHVNADPAACNHNPIVQCASYIWGGEGLNVLADAGYEFSAVEKTETMRAILERRLAAVPAPTLPAKLDYEDVYRKLVTLQYGAAELCNGRGSDVMAAAVRRMGGDPTAETDLAEALCDLGLYSVEHTWWIYEAAKRLAAEKAEPPADFDVAAFMKPLKAEFAKRQLARPFGADGYLRDCLPQGGKCRIRVLNDPTAHMAEGILTAQARIIGPQIVCSLHHLFPSANAALVDLREVAKKGLDPKDTELLIVPGTSIESFLGYDTKPLLRQLAAYADKGGRILWVNGVPTPGVCDAVVRAMFVPNKASGTYCAPKYWIPMRELVGTTLAWTGDSPVEHTYVRRPTGGAGWFWEGSEQAFDAKKLPVDAKGVLAFRSRRFSGTVGVAWPKDEPRFVYMPLAAFFPYALTREKPSVTDFELRLDSAGEDFLGRAVRMMLPDVTDVKGGATIPLAKGRPLRLSLKMRQRNVGQGPADNHSQVTFASTNGNYLTFHSSGRYGFLTGMLDGKKVYLSGGKEIDFTSGDWHDFTFTLTEKVFQLAYDGRLQTSVPAALLPLKSVSFNRWHTQWDVKDFAFETLPEERRDFVEAPVFTGDFPSDRKDRTFPLKDQVRNAAGGVMFFYTTRADWRPPAEPIGGSLFALEDEKGAQRLALGAGGSQIYADFAKSDGSKYRHEDHDVGFWRTPGTRTHFAVTWNGDQTRIYVNGLPYSPSRGWRPKNHPPMVGVDLERAVVGKVFGKTDFTDLRVYRRPVTNEDVWQAYRAAMPADLIMREQMYDAAKPVAMKLDLAPGGYWMRPSPVRDLCTGATVEVACRLRGRDGKTPTTYLEKTFTEKLDAAKKLVLPELTLKEGHYVLEARVRYNGHETVRQFDVDVAALPSARQPATNDDYVRGKLIYEERFDDPSDKRFLRNKDLKKVVNGGMTYLETGVERHERFSWEVPFPENALGKPVLIEMDWPDDKPRMMGHYIYVPSKGYCDRDRLQQGIQSGVEFPLSGKMQTVKYLFWPNVATYLFELRTMYRGMPAAIAALRIYEIDGPLPRLKVEEPEGLPARRFGHWDEDQTLFTNFNRDWYGKHSDAYVNQDTMYTPLFLDYFDYTGQTTFHYPLIRYTFFFYPYEGFDGKGLPPFKSGGVDWFIAAFGSRGQQFVPIVNLYGLVDVQNAPVCGLSEQFEKAGCYMEDKDGKRIPGLCGDWPNFATNPEVQKIYLGYVEDLCRSLAGKPNVPGLEFELHPWKGLECGYDDFNVGLFEKEAGVKVPAKGRYDFLTAPDMKEKWVAWRCAKTTGLVRKIRAVLDRYDPTWKLYWTVADVAIEPHSPKWVYPEDKDYGRKRLWNFRENMGLDVAALDAIHDTFAYPRKNPGRNRWELHMPNRETAMDDYDCDIAGERVAFNPSGKGNELVGLYPVYFENMEMKKTLYPEKYSSFFQDADVKGHGRFWLKPFAYAMAANDPRELIIGAQPCGALGREEYAREFARAYRFLPALPFNDVKDASDPVTARYLPTKNGTYWYLVNLTHGMVTAKVAWKDAGTETVVLKPFELKSGLKKGVSDELVSVVSELDAETRRYFDGLLAETEAALEKVAKAEGASRAKESATVARIRGELSAGRYGEAHRLLLSLEMRSLRKSAAQADLIAKKAASIRQGRWALNCGSRNWFLGDDGVYFPDAAYSPETGYGYLGNGSLTVAREVTGLQPATIADLFREERYDVEGYRFDVPDGTYAVKIYLKWGYKPAFEKAQACVSIEANGKPLAEKLDVVKAQKGEFMRPIILETMGVEVKDGKLVIRFTAEKNRDGKVLSTSRFVNAIELHRQ